MTYKFCKKCNKNKLRTEFYRLTGANYKDTWDCRDSYCIPCRKEYSNEQAKDVKRKAVQYLGGKCCRCGLSTTHFEIYDFHHIDPLKKDITIGKNRLCFDSIKNELDKCKLYCANCHRIIHYGITELTIVFGTFKE